MTQGRKPIAAPDVEILDRGREPRAEQALVVMRQQSIADETEIRAEVYRLGQLVGARQINQWNMKMCAAADIHLLDEITKCKGYRHIPIQLPDGNMRPAQNIEEFCRVVFNKSYRVFAESRKALNDLGEECYELASSFGLPRAQMPLLINLPEDERAAVEEAMRESTGKDEVVTLIHSLANKLDEAHAEVGNLKGELAATESISSEKTKRIEDLMKANRRIQAATPDQVLTDLHAESTRIANDARGAVIGNLRQALLAVQQHHDAHGGNSTVFLAGLVSQLARDLTDLRIEFDLPEIDPDEHGWINAAKD